MNSNKKSSEKGTSQMTHHTKLTLKFKTCKKKKHNFFWLKMNKIEIHGIANNNKN
jgi:hypothetical protein